MSSLFWRRRARIGSTAETYRLMVWSNPTRPWIGGHFSVWRGERDRKERLQSVAPPTARLPADRSRPTRRTMSASGAHSSNMSAPRTKELSGHTPAIGNPTHDRRDRDRGQPLAGLAQAYDRALLMAADRPRLHRQDERLDHPLEPAAYDLGQQ